MVEKFICLTLCGLNSKKIMLIRMLSDIVFRIDWTSGCEIVSILHWILALWVRVSTDEVLKDQLGILEV